MWSANGITLSMARGDYGLTLPIVISGTTLSSADTIRLTVKRARNGALVLEKNMIPTENTVYFTISEEETALLPVGDYVYSLDWYQDGNFMCNIIPAGSLKVVNKV